MSEVCQWSSPRIRARAGFEGICGAPATHATMFWWFCARHAAAADRFHGKRVGKSKRINAKLQRTLGADE